MNVYCYAKENMRLAVVLLILMISCKQPGETTALSRPTASSGSQNKIEVRYDTLFMDDFENLFKYAESKTYNIIDRSELRDSYKGLNDWSKKRLCTDSTLKVLELRGQPISYRELNENIIRITTLNEEDNQLMILAWTLDRNLAVIGNVTLTSMGGDEGVGIFSFGEFLGDTVYSITVQHTKYDSDEIERENSYCLIFHANGTISYDENGQ